MRCLVIRHGHSTREIPLPAIGDRVGSASDNEVSLRCAGVSRHHAQVVRTSDGISLADTGSKNGIIWNGARVSSVPLVSGVQIEIGEARLTVEDLSTSDIVAGLRLDPPIRAESGSETAEGRPEERGMGSTPASALRFAQELESAAVEVLLQSSIDRVRQILAADVVLIAAAIPGAEIAVSGLAGDLPSEEELDELARRSGRAAAWSIADGPNGRFVAARCDAIPWKREFLGFVAAKLFGRGKDPAAGRDIPLAVPDGMVIGPSTSMRRLLDQLEQTVRGDLDVLLRGETGTGKELFARLIHASGPTLRGPFVAVNCAAVPAEMMEAELFGVERRAATGVESRKGLFREADGGTILLDEISELRPSLQAKLLRVLQEREVLPIGAPRPRQIRLRVISSTNQDIDRLVREGRFRRDLFFRLRGLEFVIPPLRERPEDIPSLLLAMTAQASKKYDKNVFGITQRALVALIAHPWPGNVRELKIAVERAVLLCADGGALQIRHFEHLEQPSATMPGAPAMTAALGRETVLQPRLDDAERAAILDALRRANGNKSEAARLLGISRAALYLKIRRLKLS
jgi:DNA-binding NtrC family response regulator